MGEGVKIQPSLQVQTLLVTVPSKLGSLLFEHGKQTPLLAIMALTLASQMQLNWLGDQKNLLRHSQVPLLAKLPVELALTGQVEQKPEGRMTLGELQTQLPPLKVL
jgi:hypothetical protein